MVVWCNHYLLVVEGMMSEDWRGNRFGDKPPDSSLASYTAGTSGGTSKLVTTVSSPEDSISFERNNRPIGTSDSLDGPMVPNYGSIKGHHYSKSNNFSHRIGSTNIGVQEEGNNESSVLVHLSMKPNTKAGEPVVKQSTKASPLGVKCIKCYTISLCCWSVVVIVWLGFFLIAQLPNMTAKRSIVFKDSIVLLARVDPFWYSSVTVSTNKNEQDHLLHTYVVECDNIVVEKDILRYNRTLEVDQNILLLDPTFMIDGTSLDFTIIILNSSDNGGLLSSVIISDNANSQDDFKQNKTMRNSDFAYVHNISKTIDSFSFSIREAGYYYVGLKPAGKIQFQVSYTVLGYKYIEPTNQESSCSTQRSGESCSVGVPTTISNINSNFYCVLCKLESSPFYVNQYSVYVDLKVHRSLWNMFTIAIFILCTLVTLCCGFCCICFSVRFTRRRRHREGMGYTSIQ